MSDISELQRQIDRLAGLVEELRTGESRGKLVDYFSTATKVGWSSYTQSNLAYKRFGGLLYVFFYIEGTSNATTTSVTLPFSNAAGYAIGNLMLVQDAGAAAFGYVQVASGSNILYCSRDASGSAWTSSGTKRVFGEIVVPV